MKLASACIQRTRLPFNCLHAFLVKERTAAIAWLFAERRAHQVFFLRLLTSVKNNCPAKPVHVAIVAKKIFGEGKAIGSSAAEQQQQFPKPKTATSTAEPIL